MQARLNRIENCFWIPSSLEKQKGVRGSQYAAGVYQKVLKVNGIVPSMSRKGNCWDNTPMKSWFHTLKTELVHHAADATREPAKRDLFAYIEGYYNCQRLHSALGYLTPEQAELQAA